ncbi:MAG: galactokinase [Dehalococcoidia bacterium]
MTSETAERARTRFREVYGCDPAVVVRAPGRANLIGEHTDYSHLPVMPLAIDRSLYVAAVSTDDATVLAQSGQFEGALTLPRTAGRVEDGWGRYLAGALREAADIQPARGLRLWVESDLPASGGLSSSSALTLGILAAIDAAFGAYLGREELVSRAIRAERHAGVESGGMDQTVIAFAEAGHVLRIDFAPPGRRAVRVPEGLAFVVASSGEEAAKGGGARDAYNERVIGARLAAAMLADQVGLEISVPPVLRDIVDVDVVEVLVEDLPDRISAHEVAHGVDAADVGMLVALTSGSWDPRAKVPVRRVARHILSEAQRVDAAEAAMLAGDLEALGELLNASHNSLREDFRCSTPALDRLCAAMRKAGALGARLTGAGFGGFGIAVARPEAVEAVIAAAIAATGGPAFEVRASQGFELL